MKSKTIFTGMCLLLACAPAFAQSSSNTNGNYKGLQNLVNSVNSPNEGVPGKHRWKDSSNVSPGAGNTSGSAIGAGAGTTGAGVDAGLGGKGGDKGDPAAREARRQRRLQRWDANGDGVLDDAEKEKMRAFIQEKRAQRQAQGLGGAPGPGSNGAAMGASGAAQGMGKRHRRMMNAQGAGEPGQGTTNAPSPSP